MANKEVEIGNDSAKSYPATKVEGVSFPAKWLYKRKLPTELSSLNSSFNIFAERGTPVRHVQYGSRLMLTCTHALLSLLM